MKKLSYLIIASVFALCSGAFISCTDDDDTNPPSITISLNGTEQTQITVKTGEAVNFKMDYTAEAGLKTIEFEEVNGSNITGFPKTKDFKNSTFDQVTYSQTYTEAQTYKYRTKVTDKENNSSNKEITIIVEKGETGNAINSFADIKMGSLSNTNTDPSFCASIDGKTYTTTDANANQAKIDFVFFNTAANPNAMAAPSNTAAQSVASDYISKWATKNATKLKKVDMTVADFDGMNDDSKITELVTDSNMTDVVTSVAAGNVIGFIASGKKGLMKIVSVDDAKHNIVISIKVQK